MRLQTQNKETTARKVNPTEATRTKGKVLGTARPQGQEKTVRTAGHLGHYVQTTSTRPTCNHAGAATKEVGTTIGKLMKNYWDCRRMTTEDSTRNKTTNHGANDRLSNYKAMERRDKTTGQGPINPPVLNSWRWWIVGVALTTLSISVVANEVRRLNRKKASNTEKTGSNHERGRSA